MAHAYTPGLQVTPRTLVTKTRMLPIPGVVTVKAGDTVRADQVIATTDFPGDVITVNVVNQLGIEAAEIHEFMKKKEGEEIREGEPLAENKPLIKWFKTTIPSPVTGTVESISAVTGQVLLRKPPRRIELTAYVDGHVDEILPEVGAVISTRATFVQGILGIGGERIGTLRRVVNSLEAVVTAKDLLPEHKGCVLFGGSLVEAGALKKALELGVSGLIVGGFHARDLKEWLGYELGVAITGDEPVATTLIVTEGFGQIPMARRTFDLLASREGERASISGRTQIRAGVMRPEVIIPVKDPEMGQGAEEKEDIHRGVQPGSPVRLIREPWFGRIGRVVELPPQLETIESEAKVRVMRVELAGGETVCVPRANVEVIQE